MIKIDLEKCIGCGLCADDCRCEDIVIKNGKAEVLNKSCINCGHCIAICPNYAISTDKYDMNEVIDYDLNTMHIEPTNLLNTIKFRRSIRKFNNKPVEKDKIEKIIEAGRFTATGGNRQPNSFIVVQNNLKEVTRLTANVLFKMSNNILPDENDPMYFYMMRYSKRFKDIYYSLQKGIDKLFFNADTMIIILSDKNISSYPHLDGGLAAANMEMMANSLKLGACFNGFFKSASTDEEIRQFLNIPDDKVVVTSLLLGYTDIKYSRTVPRKKAEVQWM
jgi:nitroreductase/Pyruvate/2-oxoacid:ferredoxin oxidoreductase delta subunit